MTTITRRAAFAAPLALTAPLPALAGSMDERPPVDGPDEGFSIAAVRARLAYVCEVFSKSWSAFPDPMPAEDREALLSLSDEDINNMEDPLLPMLRKYGVNLDWLFMGSMKGLLIDARIANEAWERAGAAAYDPVAPAFERWRETHIAYDAACRRIRNRQDEEVADELMDPMWAAHADLCRLEPRTQKGAALLARAALRDMSIDHGTAGDARRPLGVATRAFQLRGR